jgi:hypothetical protein
MISERLARSVEVEVSCVTRHGPVIYEDKALHRAYALRWVNRTQLGGLSHRWLNRARAGLNCKPSSDSEFNLEPGLRRGRKHRMASRGVAP